jgi:hypothetical protein
MKGKILSFVVALVVWQGCLAIALGSEASYEGLRVENVSAFFPYALFSIIVASICTASGGRLTTPRATIAGIAIGVSPSAVFAMTGALMHWGIEPSLNMWLAAGSGVGGGLSGLFASRLQKQHS